jgi:hypothetical protein
VKFSLRAHPLTRLTLLFLPPVRSKRLARFYAVAPPHVTTGCTWGTRSVRKRRESIVAPGSRDQHLGTKRRDLLGALKRSPRCGFQITCR